MTIFIDQGLFYVTRYRLTVETDIHFRLRQSKSALRGSSLCQWRPRPSTLDRGISTGMAGRHTGQRTGKNHIKQNNNDTITEYDYSVVKMANAVLCVFFILSGKAT